jgi:hypothetical protein
MDEQLGKARHPKETCEEEIIGTSYEEMDSRVASVGPALLIARTDWRELTAD